ncbi:12262_t:CDS:1, partial [Cetraspora pellucida]
HHIEIASLLKERPVSKDVIIFVLQNSDHEQKILTKNKVKAIQFDDFQIFDYENKRNIEDG